jgi:putative tryptophan/tyrosine transport system substrate-binding protein
MRRRDFAGALLLAGAARRAWAQQPGMQHRIAFVHSGIPADQLTETAGPFWVRRFFETLRGLGYAEGANLVVERYSAEGRFDRFAALAAAVVSRNPDVIVMNLNALVNAFGAATATIPIVAIVEDPIRSGLVKSLARPGGNLTGVSIDAGFKVYSKELDILKEAIPSAAKVAYLASHERWEGAPGRRFAKPGSAWASR